MYHTLRTIGILSVALLFSACGPKLVVDDFIDTGSGSSMSSTKVSDIPTGNFTYNADADFFGTAYVRGYAKVIQVNEPFCDVNCVKYDYVMFHVTETSNPEVNEFLSQPAGNAFVEDRSIGLGCLVNGRITYSNDSATYGMKENILPSDMTKTIMDSFVDQPIILRLTREQPAGGREAPACYSHFTDIAVLGDDTVPSSEDAAASQPEKRCIVGGCSAELCTDGDQEPAVSNCMYKPEFACYRNAECTVQPDGQCGWTETQELQSCLANPPMFDEAMMPQ